MINQINEFILSKGYSFKISAADLDGKYHEDRSKDDKVWFIGSVDGEQFTFTFGDWKNSSEKHFFSSSGNIPEEKLEEIKKETENKKSEQHLLTKSILEKHYAKWRTLDSLPPNKYWQKKKLPMYSGELEKYPLFFKPGDNFNVSILVCPLIDINGEIWNAQYIAEDGTKTFQPGGKIEGCFFPIGIGIGPEALHNYADQKTIYIGEGLATCLSFHKMTGSPVLTAFSSSNIKNVIKALLDIGVPHQCIVVIADWDGSNLQNTGMIEAQKCAETYHILVIAPIWPDCELNVNRDFSDIYVAGLHETQTCHEILGPEYFIEHNFIEDAKEQRQRLKAEKASQSRAICPDQILEPNETEKPSQEQFQKSERKELREYSRVTKDLFTDTNRNKNPLSTLKNFKALMEAAGAELRYNVIKKDQELLIPGESASLDNKNNVLLARVYDLCRRVNMPVGEIESYMTYLCDQNQFNPVATWIESKPWDGVKRFELFVETIKTNENSNLKNILIKKWMISAIAAAYRPDGMASSGVLVLQGPQGIGKTKWFNSLVPQDLELSADGKMLDPRDKDSVKQCICYWLVELGELDATFRKSDLAQLKAFLTKKSDMFRPAYARKECHFPRRTVFFGSVNNKEFLADDTGNRRYWTIECSNIDYMHNFDMQQVWAELLLEYKNGHKWFLTKSELALLNESNTAFEMINPIEEKLIEMFDWSKPKEQGGWEKRTASEVLKDLGFDRPTKMEVNNCAALIRKLNKNVAAGRVGGRKVLWVAPCVSKLTKMIDSVEKF